MRFGRSTKFLRVIAWAVAAVFAAGGTVGAQFSTPLPFGLFWQSPPSHWIDVGRILYGEEVGRPVGAADIMVALLDANGDTITDLMVYPLNPRLCGPSGCSPRLYSFIDADYRESIAGSEALTRVLPTDISVSGLRYKSHLTLMFGIEWLYWNGSRYISEAAIEPTRVDDAKFIQVCTASTEFSPLFAEQGDATAVQGEYCGCVGYQLAKRQLGQADIDTLANNVASEGLPTPLATDYTESLAVCEYLQLLRPWPEAGTVAARTGDARGFFDACRNQASVKESYRIGSPHRAVAFCACFAEGLATQDYRQDEIDILAQFYGDEVGELDVSNRFPDLLVRSDTVGEACISDLRHADYVNGIDRPGSPKPPPK